MPDLCSVHHGEATQSCTPLVVTPGLAPAQHSSVPEWNILAGILIVRSRLAESVLSNGSISGHEPEYYHGYHTIGLSRGTTSGCGDILSWTPCTCHGLCSGYSPSLASIIIGLHIHLAFITCWREALAVISLALASWDSSSFAFSIFMLSFSSSTCSSISWNIYLVSIFTSDFSFACGTSLHPSKLGRWVLSSTRVSASCGGQHWYMFVLACDTFSGLVLSFIACLSSLMW